MTLRTDKYDDIAKTLGSAGGLDEKQWPGLAIILRSLARDTIEECAAIAETHVHGWEQGEHTAPAAHAVRKEHPETQTRTCKHLNHHDERRYGEADAEHPRPRAQRSHHKLP